MHTEQLTSPLVWDRENLGNKMTKLFERRITKPSMARALMCLAYIVSVTGCGESLEGGNPLTGLGYEDRMDAVEMLDEACA